MGNYVIGVDYGTDSVRSVIVDAHNGNEVAASVFYYPRWKKGLYCNPSEQRFRQHPLDYIEGLENSIRECMKQAGPEVSTSIKAISVDTTGSTPVAVDETGTPLALLPAFSENPNAMFVLWKDHTSIREAAEINKQGELSETNYLKFVGGTYSSEWYWAKILHVIREDAGVKKASFTWVEHCDWIPFLLTGGTKASEIKRSVCAAGHKALWSEKFNGFPPGDFFESIDPLLSGYVERLPRITYGADQEAGTISKEWAKRLGLSENTKIGIGAFDAHMGAVGGQIEPYYLSKVMGTSTCDMLVAPAADIQETEVSGICGQVNGSIIPGMVGLEAGQSAFGDVYAWFRDVLLWPIDNVLNTSQLVNDEDATAIRQFLESELIGTLSKKAAEEPFDVDSELALDWLNGRRTPDADQSLRAGITGLNLASTAPRIFRALAEGTCFGARKIVDRFRDEGIPIKGLIGIGGVAKKSPYIMQMMADVMGMPIKIHSADQSCAAGAAMFAATVAGIYPDVSEAMQKMGRGFDATYMPDENRHKLYEQRYKRYSKLAEFVDQPGE